MLAVLAGAAMLAAALAPGADAAPAAIDQYVENPPGNLGHPGEGPSSGSGPGAEGDAGRRNRRLNAVLDAGRRPRPAVARRIPMAAAEAGGPGGRRVPERERA